MPPLPKERPKHTGLKPPQFGIVTILVVMALVGGLLVLWDRLGTYGMFWLIVGLLAIVAHVAGALLGSQLQEPGSRPADDGPPTVRQVSVVTHTPATRLSQRYALGWPLLAATLCGAVASGALGGYWLARHLMQGEFFRTDTLVVGILAFVALGGIWSFVAAGFLQVTIGAWWQATRRK